MAEIKLEDHERQRCEVYSRVMGYHRPIEYWNIGKKAEWRDRVMFVEAKCFPEEVSKEAA